MKKKIAIIDYGLGNLFSVRQACLELGTDAEITSDAAKIKEAHGIILPGVGAFSEAMNNLRSLGLEDLIKAEVAKGKPFFGVCLGLQLIFTESEEFGSSRGLGLLEGKVRKFPVKATDGDKLRVPQIAWNKINQISKDDWNKSPYRTLDSGEFMYFVHSFFVEPSDSKCALSTTSYGGHEYCSSVMKDNVFAVQFHPEKSGAKGLEIYKNWIATIG